MPTARRIEFVSAAHAWAILPRSALSPADREKVVPTYVAVSKLDGWCSDPAVWPEMLALFKAVTGSAFRPPATADVELQIKPVLRRTLERGAWLALSTHTASRSASSQLSGVKAVLRITSPANNTVFVLDDTPRMPALQVSIRLEQGLVDVTNSASVAWTAEVRHNPRTAGDKHGPNREFRLAAAGQSVGEKFSIAFTGLLAGQLTINVQASVRGQVVSASTAGLSIIVRSPTRAAVQAEIADDLLQRLACHESGQRQFDCTPGDTTRSPLWSRDNLGGVGLFQITVPQPTQEQVWNWRANVAAGRQRLEQGRRAARNYPQQIRRSHTLADMLRQLNSRRRAQGRPALNAITIPELAPDQVEDDAVRAFNGYGGNKDQFGFALHEFRLKMRGNELDLAMDEARGTATANWERVPVAARGHAGDPNYVHNVHAASPSCGG